MEAPRSLRLLPVFGTFLLGFVGIVAVALWQGRPMTGTHLTGPVPGAMSASATPERATPGVTAGPSAGAPADARPGSPPQAPPVLPVQLFFQNTSVHNDPQNPRKQTEVVEGRMINTSATTLSIRIRVASATRPDASTEIELGPSDMRAFGFQDGLEMHPNDVLTLSEAHYPDLVTKVAK